MSAMKSFLAMLSFFTALPLRLRFEIGGDVFRRGLKYLPLVALLIGIPVGAVMLLEIWLGRYVAALLALTAYLLITGGLHVDGLADTLDALGSRRDRETMLRIMKDSRVGTFGVLGVCVYVAGMLLLLAQAGPWWAALFPLAGRTAALLCARLFACARPGGMGSGFVDAARAGHAALTALTFMALVAACALAGWLPAARAAWLAGALVLAAGIAALAVRGVAAKLGGVTGDVIGFGIETAQLAFLLAGCLCARLC